ncbi:MAG: beta-ketoacyl synthase N-terminal-like domain-containing protein, partial [Planctomycetota bacterium]|nr:beta-ketoacyl synthase N-terminal-like domain-containing protein [Planctomycetota bacterium]
PSSIKESYWHQEKAITDVSEWTEYAMNRIEPLWMLKYLPNMIASHIAISIDAQGPNNSIIQGDASGLLALIEAADVIRRGWADVMVTGGTGSQINSTFLCYHGIDNLAEPGDDPAKACRPFDQERTGTVGGEGAGMIVIEKRSHAEARGAEIYGSLDSFDYGYAKPEKDAQINLLKSKINRVIEKSGLDREQVSHVNSQASGERVHDEIVAQAIEQTLGSASVSAYKGNFGNLGPAGPVIETCAMLQALKTNVLPATINCDSPDANCPVNVVTENLHGEQVAAIKLSGSKAGQQVAALFKAEA